MLWLAWEQVRRNRGVAGPASRQEPARRGDADRLKQRGHIRALGKPFTVSISQQRIVPAPLECARHQTLGRIDRLIYRRSASAASYSARSTRMGHPAVGAILLRTLLVVKESFQSDVNCGLCADLTGASGDPILSCHPKPHHRGAWESVTRFPRYRCIIPKALPVSRNRGNTKLTAARTSSSDP